MKINVSGYIIQLNEREVTFAKKKVSQFLLRIKNIGEKHCMPSFYFTVLIVAHVMTGELLDMISAKNLSKVMDALYKIQDKKEPSE